MNLTVDIDQTLCNASSYGVKNAMQNQSISYLKRGTITK